MVSGAKERNPSVAFRMWGALVQLMVKVPSPNVRQPATGY